MSIAKLKIAATPYTYVLEWTKLGKRYIGARWAAGCHPSDLWNSYFTSSEYVAEFVKEHGAPDVILIDQTFDNAMEAMAREQELQYSFNVRENDAFLNKAVAGVWDHKDTAIIEKIRQANIGKKHTDEHKAKIGAASKALVRTPEHCAKISAGNLGKPRSKEHKANLVKALMGNTRRKGTKTSEQGRKNMSLARMGMRPTDETKRKMSLAHMGRKHDIVTCPHCQKTGGSTGMRSWHFDHCKMKIGE